MKTKSALMLAAATAVASLVSLSAYAYAPSEDGLNRNVEIVNTADYAILNVQAINVDHVGGWHSYLGRIKVGDSGYSEIDDGMGYCRFDIYIYFADSSHAFLPDVNVCDEEEIAVA